MPSEPAVSRYRSIPFFLLGLIVQFPAPATAATLSCSGATELESLASCISAQMPGSGASYTAPGALEQSDWRTVVSQMLNGACDSITLPASLSSFYDVRTFTDSDNLQEYCLAMEVDDNDNDDIVDRGWGTFIVNKAPSRDISIDIPHPKHDLTTDDQGIAVFKAVGARTFLMSGAHRDAGGTSSCQSSYDVADAAHNDQNLFQATVIELENFYSGQSRDFHSIQFHGMAASTCPGVDVYITHGSSATPAGGDKIAELKNKLLTDHPGWAVTVPGDSPSCSLNATTNVQGRYLNGVAVANVCGTAASGYSGRFIHIEQDPGYRDASDWINAIVESFPATLPNFSFAVTADQRQYAGSGSYDSSSYYRGAVEALDQVGAGEFMLSPGDIDPVADSRWTIDQILGALYTWYPIVGNHELPGDGTEGYYGENMDYLRSYDYGAVNPGPSGCPETTFSFDYVNVHFIAINEYCDENGDTQLDGDVSDHVYNWLVTDIQGTAKDHIFVFGHEPAYPQPDMDNGRLRHNGDSLDKYTARRDRFWNLLRDEGVLAYIHGHTHNTSAVKIDGVWHVDVGHARGAGDTGAASTFAKVNITGVDATLDIYRDDHSGAYDYLDIHHNRLLTGSCATVDLDATEDTYIDAGSVGGNYGSTSPLIADGSPDLAALIKWGDLSSIPDGAFINTASIRVNVTNESDDGYEVYQLLRDWEETEATWNQYAAGSNWQTSGAQGANDLGTTSLGATPGSNSLGIETFSLNGAGAQLIADWVSGSANNFGLIIQDYAETNSYRFDSREGNTPPRLTVEYCGGDGEIIGDTVYEDIDSDGTQDNGEPGIANVVVNLINDTNGNGVVDGPDTLNETRTTDGSGHYLFFDKPAGDYIVDVVNIPPGYTLTTANEPYPLTGYTPGTITNNVDFGYQQLGTGSIGGLIWYDANADGTSSGESGISGVTVDLYRDVNNDNEVDGGDIFLATQTTNGSGSYDFTGLPDAEYIVDVTDTGNLLTGMMISGGSDPAAVSLTGGEDINGLDFGYADATCTTVNMEATEDTYIDDGTEADNNYGNSGTLLVDGSPDLATLIKWNLTSIPAGATINSASVRVNVTDPSSHSYELYQLLQDWVENQATWNQYATGSNWQTAGAQGASDRGSSSIGATPGSNSTGLETIGLNAAGLQAIAGWVGVPANNYGLIIQNYSRTDGYDFDSSEGGTPPRLTVEYCEFDPTAATIGRIGLELRRVPEALNQLGIGQMDTEELLALLEVWDPGRTATLADADRAELLAALRNFLDPDGDGQVVVLHWETLEERGTIGFYAERQTANKIWKRLNNDMLPGLIDAPLGAEYLLFDPEAGQLPEYLYRLIEVEAWGTQKQHGPWLLRLKN